jgi:hypothetical protein
MVKIIIAVAVGIFIFLAIKSLLGVRYWNRCEKEYASMITRGYSKEEALLEISKKRHPELCESTHKEIIGKFNDVRLLVNFLTGALPDGKQSDEVAMEILRDTTIEHKGGYSYKVRTRRPK